MRMIGRIEEEKGAAAFGDYLVTQGIENMIRAEQDGSWGVWVYAESQVQAAREIFARYQQNPTDPIYQSAMGEAERRAAQQQQEDAALRARTYDRDRLWAGGGAAGPLTTLLIVLSVGVAVFSHLGSSAGVLRGWFITDPFTADIGPYQFLPEVQAGQFWRLVTPIFIHFGILHILFNMMWTKDLGGMIERARGTWYLSFLVVVIAVASNVGQYLMAGPVFGGMSGVIYGLAGYAWMQGRRERGSGVFLSGQTMKVLLIWFAVCLSGLLGPIANMAHGVGLVAGVLLGLLPSPGRWKRPR